MLTIEQRNKLITENMFFADTLAKIQYKKIPHHIHFEELQSAAYLGLTAAATRYNGMNSFHAYAKYRIFGEIKDYLRSLYWFKDAKVEPLPEDLVCKENNLENIFEDITSKLPSRSRNIAHMYFMQNMTMKEIAQKSNISLTRICQILKEIKNDKCRRN